MNRLLLGILVLAGCATPADVEAEYEDQEREHTDALRTLAADRAEDLARAEAWDHHALGIPAVGWVVILCVAAVLLTILLGFIILTTHESRQSRRADEHQLNVEREKTKQAAMKRGNCGVCGTPPLDQLPKQVKNS